MSDYPAINIICCTTDSEFSTAIGLTRDYMAWLDMDLCFQDIDREFSEFSFMYGPPDGLFLLAFYSEQLAGGVGFRKLEADICEMKRLFVYEEYRGRGIGLRLCKELIVAAKKRGYSKMRLDTLKRLNAATRLYESLGFKKIAPYRYNPDPTAIFMELDLA